MKTKKTFYIGLTMILLIVLSTFLYNIFEIFYSNKKSLFIIIGILSIIGGYGLGQYWWQYIYVDKKYIPKWSKEAKKKPKKGNILSLFSTKKKGNWGPMGLKIWKR
jgi:hypothetical protein